MNSSAPNTAVRGGSVLPWIFCLALLFAAQISVNLSWSRRDTKPPAWDQSIHTRLAFDYRDRLASGGGWKEVLKPAYFNYPPLYHLSLIPFLDRVADVSDVGAAANGVYLALLILSVFFIGRTLFGSGRAFGAAALVSCYPLVIEMMRETMIDLALTAWVAFGALCLFRSENFSRRGWSIAFGVAIALGTLTKWSMPVYLAAPAVVSLWCAIRQRRYANVGLSVAFGLVILFPWLVLNFVPVLTRLGHNIGMQAASGRFTTGIPYILWYGIVLFSQLHVPFLLLFLPGLVVGVRRRELRPVLLWFVGSLVLFTLITNRNDRYTMPALPAAALLMAAWIPDSKRWPSLPASLLAAAAALYFFAFHVWPARSYERWIGDFHLPLISVNAPAAEDWRHRDIINRIEELKGADPSFSRVVMISNAPYFHSTSINIALRTSGAKNFSFVGPSKKRWFDFAEFILIKNGDRGPNSDGYIAEIGAFLAKPPEWFRRSYKEAGRWTLPDHSEAVLYRFNPDPVRPAGVDSLNFELGEMEFPGIMVRDLKARAVAESEDASRHGRLKELILAARVVDYRGIPFENVRLRFERPTLNVHRLLADGEIQIVSLGALEPNVSISSAAVLDLAAKKVKWLKDPQLEFEGDVIHVAGRAIFLPLDVKLRVSVHDGVLQPRLERLAIAHIPLPRLPFAAVTDREIPLEPNRDTPFRIGIARVESRDGRLWVMDK